LRREGVAVVGPESVREWRSPPLRVLLVNLMPDKQRTEAQFARLLGGSQHRVALTLAVPGGHVWRTAGPQHIDQFY